MKTNTTAPYKAKTTSDGHWVEGYYIDCTGLQTSNQNIYGIIPRNANRLRTLKINKTTLCRSIGETDQCGTPIWEHDIVMHKQSDTIGTVTWYQEDYLGWCIDDIYIGKQQCTKEMWNECKVIGNKFDHPHLLKPEESYDD